jgi:large subunit ribosomal protein L25
MAFVEKSHETTLLQAPIDGMKSAIRAADGLGRVSLQFEGEKGRPRKAILKNIEVDPLRHEIIHITLQEVSEDDVVTVDIAVHAVGTPTAAETEELLFTQATDTIKVKGKLSSLPESIEYDVSGMEANSHVEAGALPLPDGVDLASSPDATVFSLRPSALATAEPEPEAETEEAADATAETTEEGTASEEA